MEKCHVIAVTNQKGGVGKTTTTVNLGVGLARMGKRVLLVDADPQGSLTVSLGVKNPDELPVSIATVMQNTVDDKAMPQDYGIIHHSEGVDLLPSNIELSAFEVGLFNTMSREMVIDLVCTGSFFVIRVIKMLLQRSRKMAHIKSVSKISAINQGEREKSHFLSRTINQTVYD